MKEERLLVQRRTVVANKGAGDEDRVPPQEDGRAGVHGEVPPGLVGGAEPAVRVGQAVGLALDEHLAVEVEFDIVRGTVEFHHHVLDLAGLAVTDARGGHRLEPVTVGVGSSVNGPVSMRKGEGRAGACQK